MDLEAKRIAVYARYSSDRQNPRSIEDQLRVCRELVERRGGVVSMVFQDAAQSAASNARDGFKDMLTAAKAGLFDVLVTEDLSRIGRDVGNNDDVLKNFKSWGARLLTVNGGIDTLDDDASFVNATVTSMMAEHFRRELGKNAGELALDHLLELARGEERAACIAILGSAEPNTRAEQAIAKIDERLSEVPGWLAGLIAEWLEASADELEDMQARIRERGATPAGDAYERGRLDERAKWQAWVKAAEEHFGHSLSLPQGNGG